MPPTQPASKPAIVCAYDYTDENNRLLFQVVRLAPKDFRQRKPDDNGGWEWKTSGVRRVPYRLARVLAAAKSGATIWIVEGEKDVETLEKLGLHATTNPGGAGKWFDEYSAALKGCQRVAIIPDADEPGERHAQAVLASVRTVVDDVRVVRLPKTAKDVSEWVCRGGDREQLEQLVALSEAPAAGGVADEPELVDLPQEEALPEFPLDVLPEWLGDFVASVAHVTQTPEDLAGMLALSVVSAATGGRLAVQPWGEWREEVVVWVIAAMEPGENKSGVFRLLVEPLRVFEREERERRAKSTVELETKARILKKRAESLEAEAVDSADAGAVALAVAARAEEAALVVPKPFRLFFDDATPEALVKALGEQGGYLAHLKDEGGLFSMLAGQYKDGRANITHLLNAYDGGVIEVDRTTREHLRIERPLVTIGIALQPAALRSAMTEGQFQGRGLLERPLYAIPRSKVGRRDVQPLQMRGGVKEAYFAGMSRLASAFIVSSNSPRCLTLASDAKARFVEYRSRLELRLGVGGELDAVTAWATKLHGGGCLRLAALLAVARDSETKEVDAESMAAAIRLIETYIVPHGLAAFGCVRATQHQKVMARVKAWLLRRPSGRFTARDLCHQMQHVIPTRDALEPFLRELQVAGDIEELPRQTGQKGGRPSQTFAIKIGNYAYKTDKTAATPGFVGSVP